MNFLRMTTPMGLLGCLAALALPGPAPADEAARPAAPFGFKDLEVYRASNLSISLRAMDMNGDGLVDLIYAHNDDTSIRLLIQKGSEAGSAKPEAGSVKLEASKAVETAATRPPAKVNELEFDQRFRIDKIYTEKKIYALETGELNADGKPDLVYYGDPKELVVIYQGGEWGSRTEKFPITDGSESSEGLRIADIDRDGLADIALLGKGKIYLVRQRPGGALSKPEYFYISRRQASELYITDIDGDGEKDLVTLESKSERPVTIRFQRQGTFGPEVSQKMSPITQARFEDINGDAAADLIAVQGQTRRMLAYRWMKRPDAAGSLASRSGSLITEPRHVAFNPENDPAQRRVIFGDLNGDQRADILVTYGDAAEAEVILQNAQGELTKPVRSPSLSDIRSAALGDFHGAGRLEIAAVSAQEKVLGFSRWLEIGRLSPPRTVPLDNEPLVLAACPLPAGLLGGDVKLPPAALVHVSREPKSGKFNLQLLSVQPHNEPGPVKEELKILASAELQAGANPDGVQILDANGDGLPDALVFVPYEDPRLYLLEKKADAPSLNKPAEAGAGGAEPLTWRDISKEKDFGIGQLSKLVPRALTLARFPIDRSAAPAAAADDLLVASKSHARALRLERVQSGWQLKFLEQFSGRGAVASLQGAAAVNLDGDPDLEVLLYDKGSASLDILDRGQGSVYETVQTIPLPGFELIQFAAVDLNGDGALDVAAVGKESIAIFFRGRDEHNFVEVAQFDPGDENFGDVKNFGRPDQIGIGDFNSDGAREIFLTTAPRFYLTFLLPEKGASIAGALKPSLRFQIFEEKSYMRDLEAYGPREMVVVDLNGDKKDDLALLIHDRILIYMQD